MINLIMAVAATVMALALSFFVVAKAIFALREMDKDAHEAALKEMRSLAESAMKHLMARSPVEAAEAVARTEYANEFLDQELGVPPEKPGRPRMVTTVDGEEIDLREYDLF